MKSTSTGAASWSSGWRRGLIAALAFVLYATAASAQSLPPLPSRSISPASAIVASSPFSLRAMDAVGVRIDQSGQPTTAVRQTDSLLWDKSDLTVQSEGVDHFDVCFDAAPCLAVPLNQKIGTSYGIKLPPLLVGPHSVTVSACNPAECSDPSAPLKFTFAIKPTGVTSVRTGSGG